VAELTVRLVFSLAVVLGLLMLCARLAGRRFQGRHDAMVQVVHRQAISRNASVSVVNVAGRVLVLGTTESGIRLLTELDPDEVDGMDGATDPAALALVTPIDGAADGAADVLLREQEAEREAEHEAEHDVPQHPAARPGRHLSPRGSKPGRGGRRTADQQGALSGSLLSVQTWRQALGAVTGRAS
jgi:flagellar protein FliO/FliZ